MRLHLSLEVLRNVLFIGLYAKTMALAKIARALLLQGFQALEPAVSRLQRLFKYNFRPVSDYLRPLKPGMKQEDFGCREEKNHREI